MYSGDDINEVLLSGEGEEKDDEVLGSYWALITDTFKSYVTLGFKMKRQDEIHVSKLEELLYLPPELITYLSMLSNVHRIFDPMGLLILVLLQSKLLLRLT